MDVETAIRTRRTHKVYGGEPVDDATLRELLELATYAPNHHLTNPWRFRVLGPAARERLRAAADAQQAGSGAKLDRAPTLIAVTVRTDGEDPDEDRDATAVATYLVLLGAHARGLAGYWRTPGVLKTEQGRAALGIPPEEDTVALVHLGPPRQDQYTPNRAPLDEVAVFLD
ncbi:MAG TPA: nitroreductase family protein [Solirubrobacteraceae bacterium]